MFDEITKVMKLMVNDKELMKTTASLYRNFYEALFEAGFTEEQAMQIVCSHSVLPKQS